MKSIRLYKFGIKKARNSQIGFKFHEKFALKYDTEEKGIISYKYFLEPQQPIFWKEKPQDEGKSCWILLTKEILQAITERNVSAKCYET